MSELALKSISCRIDELIMRWYDRLVKVMRESPDRLISRIFRERCEEIDAGKAEMSSLRRVKEIMQKYNNGMSWFDREIEMNEEQWKKKVKQQTDEEDRRMKQQQQQQHHQLHLYTHLFPSLHLQPQPWLVSTHNLGGMHVKLQLRSDTLPLRTTLARWNRVNREEEKTCECCDMNEEEDRNHFLLRCKLYDEEREKLIKKIKEKIEGERLNEKVLKILESDNVEMKVLLLLGKEFEFNKKEMQIIDQVMSHFLYACWRRRKNFIANSINNNNSEEEDSEIEDM